MPSLASPAETSGLPLGALAEIELVRNDLGGERAVVARRQDMAEPCN